MGLELLFWLVPRFHVSAVAVAFLGFFLGPLFPAAIVSDFSDFDLLSCLPPPGCFALDSLIPPSCSALCPFIPRITFDLI